MSDQAAQSFTPPPNGNSQKAEKYIQQITDLIGQNKLQVLHTDLSQHDPSSLKDHYRIDLADHQIEISHSKQPDTGRDSYVMLFTNLQEVRDNCTEKKILAYLTLDQNQFKTIKSFADEQIQTIIIQQEEKKFNEAIRPIEEALDDVASGEAIVKTAKPAVVTPAEQSAPVEVEEAPEVETPAPQQTMTAMEAAQIPQPEEIEEPQSMMPQVPLTAPMPIQVETTPAPVEPIAAAAMPAQLPEEQPEPQNFSSVVAPVPVQIPIEEPTEAPVEYPAPLPADRLESPETVPDRAPIPTFVSPKVTPTEAIPANQPIQQPVAEDNLVPPTPIALPQQDHSQNPYLQGAIPTYTSTVSDIPTAQQPIPQAVEVASPPPLDLSQMSLEQLGQTQELPISDQLSGGSNYLGADNQVRQQSQTEAFQSLSTAPLGDPANSQPVSPTLEGYQPVPITLPTQN